MDKAFEERRDSNVHKPPASTMGPSHGSDKRPREMSEEAAVRERLAAPRMNRQVSLPECMCLQPPRVVSYAEVGDPNGLVAFLLLGMDSHRYLSLLLDDLARAHGVRLICLDRPGRGFSSNFEEKRPSRVIDFPQILKAFCKIADIKFFALLGQSLGATYALRCAQELQDMVATTIYLVSPWVPLSVPGSNRSLAFVERLPSWLIKGGMSIGTAVPRLLASAGGLSFMARGCSEKEAEAFSSKSTMQVLKTVVRVKEASNGVALDAMTALEKERPLGFDYRDVYMPVHVFHGRSDQMVPFAAAQWMAEEMPACTVSAKVGGTHALWMDSSVISCIFECMCQDFKDFMIQAVGRRRMRTSGEGAPLSFPAHIQRFQVEGTLLCRQGVLVKAWESRHFVLEGYQLHELLGPVGVTARRRMVDIRGCIARLPNGDVDTRANHHGAKIFSFTVEDANHRVLYDLAASTSRERAYWMDVLMKASSFSKGPVEEQRNVALNKRLFVTTRSEKKRGFVGGEVDNSIELGWATVHGTSDMPRRSSLPVRRPSATTPVSDQSVASSPHANELRKWSSGSIMWEKKHHRRRSGDYLYGTPLRHRGGQSQGGHSWGIEEVECEK